MKIRESKDEVENLNQYVRRNNVILGIPEKSDEDTNQLVIRIGERLGMTLEERDVDISHRLPSRAKGVPRPSLVKFNNRWMKQKIMMSAAANQKPKSDFVGFDTKGKDEKPLPIYFNDHQTKLNASMAKRIRDLKREREVCRYKIRNGVVSVKVKEEEDYQVVNTIEKLQAIEKSEE